MAVTRNITTENDGSNPFGQQSSGVAENLNVPKNRKYSSFTDKHDRKSFNELNETQPELGTQVFDTDSSVLKFWNGNNWVSVVGVASENQTTISKRVIVNNTNVTTTLGGVIDSTAEYFIDGIIDMGSTQIIVPSTGITIKGMGMSISALVSTVSNHTMFISESLSAKSGNVFVSELYFVMSGGNSQIFNLYSSTGFHAAEFAAVNFENCSAIGQFHDYRQWLESNTGRFGGTPTLTFHGLWRGGAKISDAIIRNLDSGFSGALFEEGSSFTMNSRFYAELNADLPANASITDFVPANFPYDDTVQFASCIITRNGVSDADDANLTPNLSATAAYSKWHDNAGLPNTFTDNFTKIVKGINPPAETDVLWLEDELDHVSLYSWDDRISNWTGTERQYEFITAHNIEPDHYFEVAAGLYAFPMTHDAIPVKIQVIMESAVAGSVSIEGESAGVIGTFILDGSSANLQGAVVNPQVINKGDSLSIRLNAGSQALLNSVIVITVKNVG